MDNQNKYNPRLLATMNFYLFLNDVECLLMFGGFLGDEKVNELVFICNQMLCVLVEPKFS